MSNISEKFAVVLLNLGAPESLDDVKPFLRNLFNDPDIIDLPMGKILRPILAWNITRKRLPESMEIRSHPFFVEYPIKFLCSVPLF